MWKARPGRNCVRHSPEQHIPQTLKLHAFQTIQIFFETTDCILKRYWSTIDWQVVLHRSRFALKVGRLMVLKSNKIYFRIWCMLCWHNAIGLYKDSWSREISLKLKKKEGMKGVQESKNLWAFGRWEANTRHHHGLGEAPFNLVPIAIEHQLISFF